MPLAAPHPPKGGIRTRDRIPTLGDAAKPYTRDSANQAFFDYRRAILRLHQNFSPTPARGVFGVGRFLCIGLLAVTALVRRRVAAGDSRAGRRVLRQLGLQRIAGRGVTRMPGTRVRGQGRAAALAAARNRARALDGRRPLLLLRVLLDGQRAYPVGGRPVLSRVLSDELCRPCAAPAQADAGLPRKPLPRRRDRVAGGRRARSGGRLRRGVEVDGRQHARRRHEPRLSARRRAAARARRRHVRTDRLAVRRHVGVRRDRFRGLRDDGRRVPLRDGSRDLQGRRPARRRLAAGAGADRVRGLAADPQARRRTRRRLADADAADVLRARRALVARLRPLRPDQHARDGARVGHDRRRHRPRRAHVPRARAAASR